MKYSDKFANLWKSASKERYTINALYLDAEKKTLCATDGYIMAILDASDSIELGEESFNVPVAALNAATKLRKSWKNVNEDHICIRPIKEANSFTRIGLYDRSTNLVQTFDTVPGKFPNYDAVVPKNNKTEKPYEFVVKLDAALLLSLTESLNSPDAKTMSISLFVSDATNAVIVGTDSNGAYGAIMPMRANNHNLPDAFWRKLETVAETPVEIETQQT
jgi:hypothetical protein